MDLEEISELKKIIELFANNGCFSIELDLIKHYKITDSLISSGCLKVKKLDKPCFIKENLTFIETNYVDLDTKLLEKYPKEIELVCTPDRIMMLKKMFPLDLIFLSTDFYQMIKSDPKYSLYWKGYYGELSPADSSLDSGVTLYIQHLCLGIDCLNDIPIFVIFLDQFAKLNDFDRGLIKKYVIEDDSNLYLAEQNIKNLIDGKRLSFEEISIFDVVEYGLNIISELMQIKYNLDIFSNSRIELMDYNSIFYPTRGNYSDFIMALSFMFIENLNYKNLQSYVKLHYEELKGNNVGLSLNPKDIENLRSRKLLELILGDCKNIYEIMKPVKSIWVCRSLFAHEKKSDEYNQMYLE